MVMQESGIGEATSHTRIPAQFSSDDQGWQNTLLRSREEQFAASRPRLLRLARLRGVPPDVVEDVVQETLLEAWKHLDRLYNPAGFHLWLDEICRNICRRYARKHTTESQRLALLPNPSLENENEEDASPLNMLADPHIPDPVEALSHQDLTVLLDRALGSLSANAREAMEFCYLLELPQREVAARLGLSLSALEARLHRARLQLRQVLNGPLRDDAQAFGLLLDSQSAEGWQETRLWCMLCGQRRLSGLFLAQPDGSVNLHMQCPACEQRYGLSDLHSSNVHSRGLISLTDLQAFRPAWKRTMQARTQLFMNALTSGVHLCPYCGKHASLRLVDKMQAMQEAQEIVLPASLIQYPYQFWIVWECPQCGRGPGVDAEFFAASDLVYWSHERSRQFMLKHPRWISEPEMLVEYAGQSAIRFQITDLTSSERLIVLAQRQTLRILTFF